MSALGVAPWAAAAAVVAAAVAVRPSRAGVDRRPLLRPTTASVPGRAESRLDARIGRRLRRALRRPDDPASDRRLGRLAVVVPFLFVIDPILAVMLVGGVVVATGLRRRSERRARVRRVVEELPEVVDLLTLVAASGATLPLAIDVVASRGAGRVAAGLGRARRAAARGADLADALDEVPAVDGDEVRPLVRVLTGALRDGTEVVGPLERLAVEVRTHRRRLAEEQARRLPVQLLFPLVVCVLPAFGLLTVVPLLSGALASLPG